MFYAYVECTPINKWTGNVCSWYENIVILKTTCTGLEEDINFIYWVTLTK